MREREGARTVLSPMTTTAKGVVAFMVLLSLALSACGGDNKSPTAPTPVRATAPTPPPPRPPPTAASYQPLAGLRVSPGRVQFLFSSAGRCIIMSSSSVNGVGYTTHTSKWQRRDSSTDPWTDISGTQRNGLCSYSPSDPGEYRLVGEVTIDGTRGKYSSENTITR